MHAWEQIQLTLEYLEEHLDEKVDIEALAKMASLSPFYYQRLFRRLVKKPVAEYAKLRRMARAVDALRESDKRILDIALELGFTSHEHFTRVFKETFGITPESYRSHPQALNRMTKPELLLHYTMIDEGVPLVTEGIVLEINRAQVAEPIPFVGLRYKAPVTLMQGFGTESGADPLDDLWQRFHAEKTAVFGLPEERDELGVAYPCPEEGFFYYFAGARRENEAPCDAGVTWTLPAGEYVVCAFEAETFEALVMDALYKAEQYLYGTWLPRRKLETEPFCAVRYATHGAGTTRMEVWLQCK